MGVILMKDSKKDLFLDFDNTIANSLKRIVEMYNEDYISYPDFKKADWRKVRIWNFGDQCHLLTNNVIERYFGEKRFFDGLELYENAKEAIERLSELYTIKIVSMGNSDNLKYKGQYILNNLNGISEYIPINFKDADNKEHIDMSDGIFIDDNTKYLNSSNAKVKIVYGELYEWNKDWNGLRFQNWIKLENYLTKLY